MLRAPFSSEFDPSEEAEGSTDPLGLLPSYERLADRLLPAVTVRMGHPRFVTAIAVGARLLDDWDDDAVAADGITPPWLVWEWFVVEAFVRSQNSPSARSGVPGIQKVRRALRDQRPVCATAYLKTPNAFGFTGVFRRLAYRVGIITDDGALDDGGYELVSAWATDQGLDGFLDGSGGAGHAFRERLRRAVAQGMDKGHTTYQSGEFWRELASRLDPTAPGRREKTILTERILSRAGDAEMIAHLKDALVGQGGVSGRDHEASFLRKLARKAPAELQQLLTAIDAYEMFGRVITDAFDGLRYCASSNGGAPVGAQIFSATKSAQSALALLAPSLARVRSHPTLLEWEHDEKGIAQAVDRFDEVRTTADLFDAILHHHDQVQSKKPPHGKRAWFERGPHGRVVLRAGYTLPEPPSGKGGYVHEYRIPTFSGFLSDLGVLQ
ncbi:hypothetical protein HU230_0032900 [Bradyrhizobium quebecense]|uniref:hypothetical protein n=1 Tax=Bradyrhizobium quebecense TaxID=2748629 RepID=UPI001AEE8798|nr:hypothetical protein [Bradyrhizobium quebecense]UGA43035.1 hypothetical protein HU230_0032900 [Bradyrhizobium quebecense]